MSKILASILLEVITNGNKRRHTTSLTPLAHKRKFIFTCKQHTIYDQRRPEPLFSLGNAYILGMFKSDYLKIIDLG